MPATGTSGVGLLPTYIPVPSVNADLPGTESIPDGYFTFPKTPFKSVADTPSSNPNGEVTWLTNTRGGGAPLTENSNWQEVNRRLGTSLSMQLTPLTDYNPRVQTVLAGGDLPDVVFLGGNPLPEQARLMQTKFADLTPYLSGDAIKEYPNLAGLPTIAWKACVFNSAIYAVPTAYMRFFWMLWARQDLLDNFGAPMPSTADEFKRVLQQVNQPQSGVWAIASITGNAFDIWNTTGGMYAAMFGAPNQWGESGGTFTRTFETEQFKAAVGFARDLYAMGVYHPDSLNWAITAREHNYDAGKFVFEFGGMSTTLWNEMKQFAPGARLRQPVPPPGDGSKGHYWYGNGVYGITGLKQATPERIKEILRIMNYLAAPFGSEEYLVTHFGVQGIDYEYDGQGNPVVTPQGEADRMPWGAETVTVPAPAQVLYNPPDPDFVRVIQADQKAMDVVGVQDASIGLFSNTNAAKSAGLNQAMTDGLTEIVKGTQPLSTFDQLVRDWRANGGDQIRSEFEAAFAATKP